jgi:hypothetical protein
MVFLLVFLVKTASKIILIDDWHVLPPFVVIAVIEGKWIRVLRRFHWHIGMMKNGFGKRQIELIKLGGGLTKEQFLL